MGVGPLLYAPPEVIAGVWIVLNFLLGMNLVYWADKWITRWVAQYKVRGK